MKTKFLYALMAVCATSFALQNAAAQGFTINEVDAQTPGADTAEFVEIYNPAGAVSLAGFALVFINGNGEVVEDVFDLGNIPDVGALSTDANGFLVIGNSAVPNVGPLTFRNSGLQNGADAVALYNGANAIALINGTQTTVTTDDLVDAVAYDDGDADDAGLLAALGLTIQVSEVGGTDRDIDSVQRFPDGTGDFFPALATPGEPNFVPAPVEITISLSATTIEESSSDSIIATISRTTSEGDLVIALSVDDSSEAEILEGDSVTIDDGFTSVTVDLLAVDDSFPDGDQTVTFTAEPVGGPAVSETFDVTDDGNDEFTIIFNEVNAIAQEDLNGDGLVDGNDDFIEVYNSTNATVDLSFFEILESSDDATVHVFPEGTLIEPGCSLIVGSAGFSPGSETNRYGTAFVQNASEGNTLRITDQGDTMRLRNDTFDEIFAVTIPDLTATADQGSWALQADGDAASGYAQHLGISTPAVLSSPGAGLDGTAFCIVTTPVMISVTPAQVLENSSDPVTATVSIPSALTEDVTVFVFSADLSGLSSFGDAVVEEIIPAGDTSIMIDFFAVDDSVSDGTQTINLVGGALGFLNATAPVDVLDDGNDPDALQICDIAFVGYISDNPDAFAFVTFVDIGPGTEINFTDHGWISDAAGFRQNEGLVTWTAPEAGIPALTVVTISNNSPYAATASTGLPAGAVQEIGGGGPALSSTGDQIFAFQGSVDDPVLLAGFQMDGEWLPDGSTIGAGSSTLPSVFATTGAVFIDPELDNAAYTGATTAVDVAAFKALVFDPASFASDDSPGNITFPSASFVFGVPSDYAVTLTDCSVTLDGDFLIEFTATGPSNVFGTADFTSYTLLNTDEPLPATTTSFTDTDPPAGKFFYLIQDASAAAPVPPAS